MTTVPEELDAQLCSPHTLQDPYPVYAALRERGPVLWSRALGHWLVTSHEHALAVLRDPANFSSFGTEAAFLELLPADVRARIPTLVRNFTTPSLVTSDPPRHARLRDIVKRSFTPRAVAHLRPRVAAIVDGLLRDLDGECDLVADLAYPLPAIVIAELFGARQADRDRFKGWAADVLDFMGTAQPDPARAIRAEASLAAFREHVHALAVAVRAEPRDDVLTQLATARDEDGQPLSDDELLATCVVMLTAGHETTTNLITSTVHGLLSHPEQLERVRHDPALLEAAIEEALRWEAPAQRVRRVARRDVRLAGATIHAGDVVMVNLGAANRDPAVFADPDAFDVRRERGRHLAFGHGIHFCVGAGLARLEAPMAIEALLTRFPRLALEPDRRPRWSSSLTVHGLTSLRLRLGP